MIWAICNLILAPCGLLVWRKRVYCLHIMVRRALGYMGLIRAQCQGRVFEFPTSAIALWFNKDEAPFFSETPKNPPLVTQL